MMNRPSSTIIDLLHQYAGLMTISAEYGGKCKSLYGVVDDLEHNPGDTCEAQICISLVNGKELHLSNHCFRSIMNGDYMGDIISFFVRPDGKTNYPFIDVSYCDNNDFIRRSVVPLWR